MSKAAPSSSGSIDAAPKTGGKSLGKRQFWDDFALQYERLRESNTLLTALTLHGQIGLADAKAVLEVGAGAGAGALAMIPRLGQGSRLVVTDLSEVMLELARKKLQHTVRSEDGVHIDIVNADAQQLPFEDASFDRYVANLALMLVDKPEQALAEAARVLRPDGRIALSVWGRREHSSLRTLFFETLTQLGIEPPHAPAGPSPFQLGMAEKTTGMLARAGFTRILTWYQPSVEAIEDGNAFATDILATEEAARQLDPSVLPAVHSKLAALADERLALGQPLALDILVATARKPPGESGPSPIASIHTFTGRIQV